MPRIGRGRWLVMFLAACVGACSLVPLRASADDMADAAALFASGNAHFQLSQRVRGPRRTRELELALDDYRASLALVRSRNVLFNASLAFEALGRWAEAFDFMAEYQRVAGLADDERAEAITRLSALRPRVSVLAIESSPAGAQVWLDRRDLPARGVAPLEFATAAGEHTLWVRLEGYLEAELHVTAIQGETHAEVVRLTAEPRSVQILAPADAPLTMDGVPIIAGQEQRLSPGSHVVRLELMGTAPVERRFEVLAGAPPMVIDLAAAVRDAQPMRASLRVTSPEPVRVLVDGLLLGAGPRVEVPVDVGAHDIRIDADGYDAFVTTRTFALAEQATLAVRLTARDGSLRAARVGLGVTSALAVLASIAVGAAAAFVNDEFSSCVSQAPSVCSVERATGLANSAESVGMGAYSTWGISALVVGAWLTAMLFPDPPGSSGEFLQADAPSSALQLQSVTGGTL